MRILAQHNLTHMKEQQTKSLEISYIRGRGDNILRKGYLTSYFSKKKQNQYETISMLNTFHFKRNTFNGRG